MRVKISMGVSPCIQRKKTGFCFSVRRTRRATSSSVAFEGELFVVFACHFLTDAVHTIPSETGRDVAGKARILLRIVAGGLF